MADKQISYKINEHLHQRLKIKAIRMNIPINALVTLLISEGLKEKKETLCAVNTSIKG